MNFETLFEFNEQEFTLKVVSDKSYVYIQILCIDKALLWSTAVSIESIVEKFNFLDGCFFKPDDLAEYLIYQINSQEFRLESADDESKVLHLIFWVQKEKEDEIEQYEFYFSLVEEPIEYEKKEDEQQQNIKKNDPLEEVSSRNPLAESITRNEQRNELDDYQFDQNMLDEIDFISKKMNNEQEIEKSNKDNEENVNLDKNLDGNIVKKKSSDLNSDNYKFEIDDKDLDQYVNHHENDEMYKFDSSGKNMKDIEEYEHNFMDDLSKTKKLYNNNEKISKAHLEKIEEEFLEKQLKLEKELENQRLFEEKRLHDEIDREKEIQHRKIMEELEELKLKEEKRIKEEINYQKLLQLKLFQDDLHKQRNEEEKKIQLEINKKLMLEEEKIYEELGKKRKDEEKRIEEEITQKIMQQQKKIFEDVDKKKLEEEKRIQEEINKRIAVEYKKIEDDLEVKKAKMEEKIYEEIDKKRQLENRIFEEELNNQKMLQEKRIQEEINKQMLHEKTKIQEELEKKKLQEEKKINDEIKRKKFEEEQQIMREMEIQKQKYEQTIQDEIEDQKLRAQQKIQEELKLRKIHEEKLIQDELNHKRQEEHHKFQEEMKKQKLLEQQKFQEELERQKHDEQRRLQDEMRIHKLKEEKKIQEELEKLKKKEEQSFQQEMKRKEEELTRKTEKLMLEKQNFEMEMQRERDRSSIEKDQKNLITNNNQSLNNTRKNQSRVERFIDDNISEGSDLQKNKCCEKNSKELDKVVSSQKQKINDLEKKISDLYNNQTYFMEMMEKMNNLSFQILEEIKEIKEKNCEGTSTRPNPKRNHSSSHYTTQNFYDEKNLNIINETKADLLYSMDKNRSSTAKYGEIEKEKHQDYSSVLRNPFNQYNLIENKLEIKINKQTQPEKNYNNFNYKYNINQDPSVPNTRKQSYSRTMTNNMNHIDKNNSFYTNKFSNINNNFLNEIGDDETIYSISNDINMLRNNLNDKEYNENGIYNKIVEIVPSFFKNDKLFSSFEIKDQSVRKLPTSYEFGYFGIRCRDPLDVMGGKYYFSVYLQSTLKSNIFIGMTSDARMGISGGYHKSHNTFMYNLANCDAFMRNSGLIGNIMRKGRTGDIYTFYVDFEFKFMKLFLNGNELNHNNITIYSNETNFYPCIDIKDPDDCVTFVDKIILNFSN